MSRDLQALLATVARDTNIDSGDLQQSSQVILHAAIDGLEVSRVGVWFWGKDQTALQCSLILDALNEADTTHLEFTALSHPKYLEALKIKRTLVAHDAFSHPHTQEFKLSYLKPLGITSLLVSPIFFQGEMIGFISVEHRGAKRQWSIQQIDFVGSLADIFSRAKIAVDWRNCLQEKNMDATHREKLLTQAIEERDLLIKKLHHSNELDALTGLLNRHTFELIVNKQIEQVSRAKHLCAFGIFDVDHFKEINDHYGHHIGDLILKEVATRVKNCISEADYLARYGGDEFALLMTRIKRPEQAGIVAKRIIEIFKEPIRLDNNEIKVSVSFGIASYPMSGENLEQLGKNADMALYHAKDQGRNQYQFFNKDIYVAYQRQESIYNILKKTFAETFTLYFQPIFDIREETPKIIGCEALLRLRADLQNDNISIGELIDVAEHRGLINNLGRDILDYAFSRVKILRTYNSDIYFSINLSVMQLESANLADDIMFLKEKYQIDHESVVFEITENAVVRNHESVMNSIRAIKNQGFKLAMDDFGKGYSSLSRLLSLPTKILKFDQLFPRLMFKIPGAEILIQGILQICKALHLKVICEGVETKQQLRTIKLLGCDTVQGYYLAKPMPEEELIALISEKNTGEL